MNVSDLYHLENLEKTIAIRSLIADGSSYTASLVQGGIAYACKKMGEEVIETIIAAFTKDKDSLIWESADFIYHMMVVWYIAGIKLADILPYLEIIWGNALVAYKEAEKNSNHIDSSTCKSNNNVDAFLLLNCHKMGEEAIAVIMIALEKKTKLLVERSANLICFLFLIWKTLDILFETVLRELTARMALSGLQEKASRF